MSIHGRGGGVVCVSEGKLFGFGANFQNQLSPEGIPRISSPVEIVIPSGKLVRFSGGLCSSTTIVLTSTGLYGCGGAYHGHFGDTKGDNRKFGLQVIEFYKNKRVEKYWDESLGLWVLLENGKVFRSGSNSFGQMANGTSKMISTPTVLDQSFLSDFKDTIADIKGNLHTLLMTHQGRVYGAGLGSSGRRGMGWSDDGEAKVFGKLDYFPSPKTKITQIAVGSTHSLFVSRSLGVYSCGESDKGQTGHNNTKERHVPTVIDALQGKLIVKICCGSSHSVFLTKKNVVFGCGTNNGHQIMSCDWLSSRQPVLVPTEISTKLKFQTIDVTATHDSTVFLTKQGFVYSIGRNQYGQGGAGHTKSPLKTLTKAKIKITLEVVLVNLFTQKPENLVDICILTK